MIPIKFLIFGGINGKKYLALLLLAIFFSLISCVNITTYQTADTLKPNESYTYYGGGYYISSSLKATSEATVTTSQSGLTTTDTNSSLKVPFIEVGYRRGLTDKMDAGAKWTIFGSAVVDMKYHLISEQDYDVSVGGGLGYLYLGSIETRTESRVTKTEITVIDLIVPTYVSYKSSEWAVPYFSPKFIFRNVNSPDGNKISPMGGGTLGIMLGKKICFAMEGFYLRAFDSDFDMVQFGGAILFK